MGPNRFANGNHMESNVDNSELLKELQEKAVTFLKLDFAYLITCGAIFGFLKIERGELLGFAADLALVALIFIAIAIFDIYAYVLVFDEWFRAKSNEAAKKPISSIYRVLRKQPKIHGTLVLGGLLLLLMIAYGSRILEKRMEGRAVIQEAVEAYQAKSGTVPNYEQLRKESPRLPAALILLDGEEFAIESAEGKYTLRFGGLDKALGTKDDLIVPPTLRLRELYEQQVKKNKSLIGQ
jgi:hypothetical protein